MALGHDAFFHPLLPRQHYRIHSAQDDESNREYESVPPHEYIRVVNIKITASIAEKATLEHEQFCCRE